VSCAVPGAVGVCTPVPSGQDPDSECGAVSCVGQYFGWTGSSCYRKADVPAAQAACNGAGACRTPAQECTAQTTQGPATTTCSATCQSPNGATCAGTTAGTCNNVNPGNQSCGNGVCKVTAPVCLNGAPNLCVPNSAAQATETCNGLDDNCDGTIDNGSFVDSRESNDSCASAHMLPMVGSDATVSLPSAGTLFPEGDVDVYRFLAAETDSSCGCCDTFCLDEDYELTVTLSVPVGAGSYQLCAARDTCAFGVADCVTVNENSSGSLKFRLDGSCVSSANDSYPVYVRVAGGSTPPSTSCKPYGLSYFFDAGRCF
jgi:hypothetical protein